jgi:hypothetical protein
VLVIEEKEERVRLKIFYTDVTQSVTIDPNGVMVKDMFTGEDTEAIRLDFAILVFDGKEKSHVTMEENSVRLDLAGGSVRFSVVQPRGVTLQPSGQQLKH